VKKKDWIFGQLSLSLHRTQRIPTCTMSSSTLTPTLTSSTSHDDQPVQDAQDSVTVTPDRKRKADDDDVTVTDRKQQKITVTSSLPERKRKVNDVTVQQRIHQALEQHVCRIFKDCPNEPSKVSINVFSNWPRFRFLYRIRLDGNRGQDVFWYDNGERCSKLAARPPLQYRVGKETFNTPIPVIDPMVAKILEKNPTTRYATSAYMYRECIDFYAQVVAAKKKANGAFFVVTPFSHVDTPSGGTYDYRWCYYTARIDCVLSK
jgi:hypothetical protein